MNRKAYIASVFIIATIGFALGILVFPYGKEEALMYLYDKRYDEALDKYSKLYYEKHDHSVSVSIPLTSLYLHYAEEDKAFDVLQKFVKENPGNIEAKEYLGELYQNSNRPYEYITNLSEIYRLNPSGVILRKQERLFTHIGDINGKVDALKNIIDKWNATQKEYLDLAYIYASRKEKDKALDTLEALLKEFSIYSLDPQTLNFVLSFYLEMDFDEKAVALAKNYVKEVQNIDNTLLMINIFKEGKMYEEGLALINELPMNDQQLPAIDLARASLLIGAGDRELAYFYLKKEYDRKKLPKKMQGTVLSLALEYEKDHDNFLDIIGHIDLWRIPAPDLLRLANAIIRKKMTEAAEIALGNLGNDFLARHPMVSVAFQLGMTSSSKEEENALRESLKEGNYNDQQRAILGDIYYNKKYTDLAKETMLSIHSIRDLNQNNLYDMMAIFVDLGLAKEGLILLEKDPIEFSKESNAKETRILLLTATGKTKEVKSYLDQHKDLEESFLSDLFYAAKKTKHHTFALYMANKLFENNPNETNTVLLASALVNEGDIEKGMALFNTLLHQGYHPDENYLEALVIASKKDEKYRQPLHDTIQTLLKDKTLTDDTKREYGFYLLDNNFKYEAAQVFFPLAQGKLFKSDDVQNLVASWEEKIDEEQAEWAAEQAVESEGKDKGDWLSYISYSGHPGMVIGLVHDEDLEEESIVDAYLDAAGALEDKKIIADAVTKIYPKERELPRLKKLGGIAFNNGLNALSKKIYAKVLEESPSDKEALKAMGIIAFGDGEMTCARAYFEKFLCHYIGDYQLYYYYGEVLWDQNVRSTARDSFLVALGEARRVTAYNSEEDASKVKDALMIMIQIYHRLDRIPYAIDIYNRFLARNPGDMRLRIDYANFMMDVDGYRSAAALLGCRNHCSGNKNPEIEKDHLLAWARYLKETAKLKASTALIDRLLQQYPNDHRVYAAAADIYFATGQWRQALCKINKAHQLAPTHEGYVRVRQDIGWEHQPSFYSDFEYRKTGLTQKEHFYRVFLTSLIQDFTTIDFRWERDHLLLASYTNLEGITKPFHGFRERGEINIWRDFLDGKRVKGSFYFAETILGGAMEWSKFCYNDLYSFTLEWHRPSWEDVQSTIEFGTKDRIIFSQHHRFDRAWVATVTGSYNRYNLHDFPSAALTWELEVLVTYKFPRQQTLVRLFGDDTEITLNYFLDKEQVDRLKKKTDPEGVKFAPLPINNRESHNWYGFLSKKFFEGLAVEAYFGYTWDGAVKKSMLPIGGCTVVLLRREDFQIRFNYNHSASTQDSQQLVDSWLFSLRYVY